MDKLIFIVSDHGRECNIEKKAELNDNKKKIVKPASRGLVSINSKFKWLVGFIG